MQEAETGEAHVSSAVLFERDGRFYFFQPGLGVIGSGDSISSAYANFSEARRVYLDEIERAGLSGRQDYLAPRSSVPQSLNGSVVSRPAFVQEMQLFAVKMAVVLVIIGAICIAAASVLGGVASKISAALSQIQPISMADVADKASVIVRDLRALPPEKRETLRQSIGTISREIQPYLDAWRDPPPANTPNR